jgi:DNA polymerase-1
MGRYDVAVKAWVDAHKKETKHGYGMVPRELLLPYGAKDVDAPRRIAMVQSPLLAEFCVERNGYPSLWQMDLTTQRLIYEMELTGMCVDQARLQTMIDGYGKCLQHYESLLKVMANVAGIPDFNHRSVPQVRTLLFEKLTKADGSKIKPIKTTKNKPWDDALRYTAKGTKAPPVASTDKVVLEILEEEHPAVKTLMYVRKLDTYRKTWLREPGPDDDESTKGGGLKAKIWPDDRIHPHISQLAETGRFRHSKPNSANWPKRAEGYIAKIFEGTDIEAPPELRSIIIPAPGHVLMEGDFVQAELFVLAALSGDATMWDTLTTPGKDMHDLTGISSFGLIVNYQGSPIDEQYFLDLAASDKQQYKACLNEFTYTTQKGETLTRAQFKSGLRVSAKNVNFGVPYGRGALDIARQVKAETGSDAPLAELQAEIEQVLEAWKTVTYPDAWRYMESCAASVSENGYLATPWGRKRRFPEANDGRQLSAMERQAQNFPIQGTVADTCMIAMWLIDRYRTTHGLNFKIINQIHDAIMLEVPEAEIEATETMFYEAMGQIDIPLKSGDNLRLNVDVDILSRWGEKLKAA